MLQKFASPAEQSTAKKYIDDLRSRQFAAIDTAADPSIAGATLDDALGKMADMIPSGTPIAVKLVGAQRFSASGATTVNLTFEYQFVDRWVLANVATKTRDGASTIVGFHVYPESTSVETKNQFTLSGKSALQYCLLGAAIGAAILTLFVLIICIRTRMKRRKWLWILFILFGIGKLSVNWATGQWAFMALAAQLFSASAAAMPTYSPWMISVSVPLGAILFLVNRRRLQAVDVATSNVAVP